MPTPRDIGGGSIVAGGSIDFSGQQEHDLELRVLSANEDYVRAVNGVLDSCWIEIHGPINDHNATVHIEIGMPVQLPDLPHHDFFLG